MKQNDFRQTIVLYWALLAGQILFALVVVFLLTGNETSLSWPVDLPGIIGPVAILAGFTGARAINRTQMANAPVKAGLPEKTAHYRKAVIIRSALMEGANLLMVALAMVAPNYFWLLCFAAGLIGFWFLRPSIDELADNYKLSPQEKMDL